MIKTLKYHLIHICMMSAQLLGKPRPLWRVLLLSIATLLLYYGWYKTMDYLFFQPV